MELVVLVNEQNKRIGTKPKKGVHTKDTPLHRGFSLFLFNSKRELLLTRRALNKKTFPGVWTNTVCGHPGPKESNTVAARRRLKEELGIRVVDIKEAAAYRYRFSDANGIVENEICPILVAYSESDPAANLQEIVDWKWVKWEEFLEDLNKNPGSYSPWSREEAQILNQL
ncbi:isopentenyl-diphosphate delta-isomerase [candidate division WWE3 bacterium RIFCSPLOWO2_01_FULL_39_13]|uniref:Isopentenyl-diphosphate delta-isomerase n=1 Tax=candidate division WWE3 bacterium RIFCSPLOWO2_01_FULL_39_13 TaxID=1802624 RepID=A0A1F4V4F7_UNCKA|nr:MAG: isopentenyl-diphosphate delta-isomerase [candidate division WWE3 bacterium RIFCSPLOWO2_01_FULL_39_13]